jgi:hypothetical protein
MGPQIPRQYGAGVVIVGGWVGKHVEAAFGQRDVLGVVVVTAPVTVSPPPKMHVDSEVICRVMNSAFTGTMPNFDVAAHGQHTSSSNRIWALITT